MPYIWFSLVLEALGKKLNYESLSNLLGNAFAKDAAKLVSAANPLTAGKRGGGGAGAAFAQMAGNIKTFKSKGKDDPFADAGSPLADISWINEIKAREASKEAS